MVATVGTMELHSAVMSVWNASGLEWQIKSHWDEDERDRHEALGEAEVTPGCPYPFVVFEITDADVVTRTSGPTQRFKRAIKSSLLRFSIYAKKQPTDGRSAKAIAADLLDAVLQNYGGHPTVEPKEMTCPHSQFLNCQYQRDFGMKLDDDVYLAVVEYQLVIDSPMGT